MNPRGLAARLLVWLQALDMTRLSRGFPPCGEGYRATLGANL